MSVAVVGVRSLYRDQLVRASLVIFTLASVAVVLVGRSPAFALGGTVAGLDSILVMLTLIALIWGRNRLTGTARRFWDLLASAWGCLLLVEVVFLFDLRLPFVAASFVIDALHVLFYLLVALAIDLRPHVAEVYSLSRARIRIESAAGVMVVFGLLIYFGLVVLPEPLGLSLSFFPRARGLTPFLLVRLSLDVLILGRLVHTGLQAAGHWRQSYALLAAAVFCLGIKDVLSIAQSEEMVSLHSLGIPYQVFLFLPAFFVILAARNGHRGLDGARATQQDGAEPVRIETVAASPVALYALIVPGMHFLLYPMGLLDPATRVPREVFCLAYVVILGATAAIHELLLTKDNARATAALLEAESRLVQSQRLEAIGRLAGGIAHDFNNYLTVIQGYSELVDETLDESQAKEDIDFIREAADKAGHLTGQLLAFGRRQLLHVEPVNLNEVVTGTGRLLDSLLGENIELDLELDPEVSLVLADLGQTEQVLLNLVLNARDAMLGGGRLVVGTRTVVVDEENSSRLNIEPGVYVELRVADTGGGMTEEIRAQIFEPFFTSKGLGRGTGLGLATVWGIVNQSSGAIEVESVVAQGTTMRVLLPRAELPVEVSPVQEPDPVAPQESATVLLVEDAAPVRALAERALAKSGFRVLAASNGAEALGLFESQNGKIDLVVTDVMMPEMDGVELATILSCSARDLPILFTSGYPLATLRERNADLPISTPLLHKPFTPSSLVREVRHLLEKQD